MTKEEAEKAREVEEEMDLRRGEWRSMRDLFRLNTIPPLVDTFKVSLLETTWLKASSSTCTWRCSFLAIFLSTG